MNILKYLFAETVNDDEVEELIEVESPTELLKAQLSDSVMQAFAMLVNPQDQVGTRSSISTVSSLANSALVVGQGMEDFFTAGLSANLDTIH